MIPGDTTSIVVRQGQENTELVSLAEVVKFTHRLFLRVTTSEISAIDTGGRLGKCLTPQTAQVRFLKICQFYNIN